VASQFGAQPDGVVAEKFLSQPFDERFRIGNEQQLSHATDGLIKTETERQPNLK
jgi:hypothetical protein